MFHIKHFAPSFVISAKPGCSKNNDQVLVGCGLKEAESTGTWAPAMCCETQTITVQTSGCMERETQRTYLRLNVRDLGPGKLKFT